MIQERPIKTRFGMRVAERREELGISQRMLAHQAFMSHGYLARIESGYSQPPAQDKIHKLAEVLQLPLEELQQLADLEPKSPTKIIKQFPRILALFQRVVASMEPREIASTIGLLEMRIALFDEDQTTLADNFKRMLLGELTLSEYPGGGTRPMDHYFGEWSKEIEHWIPPDSPPQVGAPEQES